MRRKSLTSSAWRRRVSAAFSLGSKMRPFEATHVLALVFPISGMLPAVMLAITTYCVDGTVYRGGDEAEPMLRFTPITIYAEPFAGLSNIAFVCAGTGLFLLPVLSGSFLAPHAIGAGVLFAFMGAGSWAFHKVASRTGGWEHAADRIGMYATMCYLAVVVIGAAFHSVTNQPATPRSLCALLTNLTCMAGTVVCITYQDEIDTRQFLGICGTVAVSANGIVAAVLQLRGAAGLLSRPDTRPQTPLRRAWTVQLGLCKASGNGCANSHRLAGWIVALFEGCVEAGISCLLFFIGLNLNSQAAACRDAAAFDASLPDATRIELRARHDMLHGTWHAFSSIMLLSLALTMHRGLCSLETVSDSPTQAVLHEASFRDYRTTPGAQKDVMEERVARLMCGALAPLLWLIRDEPVRTILVVWALIVGITVPLGVLAIWRVTRENDARWAEKRHALGATRRWRTNHRFQKDEHVLAGKVNGVDVRNPKAVQV